MLLKHRYLEAIGGSEFGGHIISSRRTSEGKRSSLLVVSSHWRESDVTETLISGSDWRQRKRAVCH